ncbi:hypothetical protein HAX54_034818 [Datura stramonium]|uniref:Uncharacterized protein n=1 Tax=Datura stramonium TaxID=4076 RepID=A0ABS8VFL8_DATST|nr:hypothetical protein [Datura stramonium]
MPLKGTRTQQEAVTRKEIAKKQQIQGELDSDIPSGSEKAYDIGWLRHWASIVWRLCVDVSTHAMHNMENLETQVGDPTTTIPITSNRTSQSIPNGYILVP